MFGNLDRGRNFGGETRVAGREGWRTKERKTKPGDADENLDSVLVERAHLETSAKCFGDLS